MKSKIQNTPGNVLRLLINSIRNQFLKHKSSMKKIIILASVVLTLAFTTLSNWNSDKMHSKLSFSITHMGISDVTGLFKDFEVSVKTSKDDFSDAVFEMSADV